MKKDPYFKYLAAIILAGLVVSLFDAAPATATAPARLPSVATTGPHSRHQARS